MNATGQKINHQRQARAIPPADLARPLAAARKRIQPVSSCAEDVFFLVPTHGVVDHECRWPDQASIGCCSAEPMMFMNTNFGGSDVRIAIRRKDRRSASRG